jgi:hypothetical protein
MCWRKAEVLQIESSTTDSKYKESAHVSGRSSDQSTQLGHLSHLDSHYCSKSQKTINPFTVEYVRKLCFYFDTIQRICLFSDDFDSDSTLISTTVAMKQCTDKGLRPHVCRVS